jgi:hypothetical protein
MKYIDEFRDGALARHIGKRIAAEADSGRRYGFTACCGIMWRVISDELLVVNQQREFD